MASMLAFRRRVGPRPPSPEPFAGAFGDLTAGLLFVFLAAVMAMALATHGQAPKATEAATGPVDHPLDARAHVVEAIQGALAHDGIAVYVDLEDGVLRLPEQLLFETGEAHFNAGADRTLVALAHHLDHFLPTLPGLEAVVIEGHTDTTPIRRPYSDTLGLYKDNWDLSYQRAKHTYEAVLADAPGLARLVNAHHDALLCVGAFGPSRPIGDNAIPGGRQLNRRIDVRLIVEAHAHE